MQYRDKAGVSLAVLFAVLSLGQNGFAQETPEQPAQTTEQEASKKAPQTQEEKDEQARLAYLKGRELFDAKLYDESAEAFREAYELSGRPILLLSIASAHERAGRFDLALRTLRDYRPFATESDATEVDFRIQTLEARIQTLEKNSNGSGQQQAETVVAPQPAPAQEDSSGMRIAGWVLTGVGVAAAAGGGVMMYLGEQDHQDVANAQTRQEAIDLVDSGDSKKLTGLILVGAGAAVAVGGITMVVLSSDEDGNEMALSVTPSGEGAVMSLTGRF